jgi:hypothetical protein
LGHATIGVEAAHQLVRVATRQTEAAWLARAQRRTVKHLREEVAAALLAMRLSGERDCPPPVDAEIDGLHALERAVLAGARGSDGVPRAVRLAAVRPGVPGGGGSPSADLRRPWRLALTGLHDWLERGLPALRHAAAHADPVSLRAASPEADHAPAAAAGRAQTGRAQTSAGRRLASAGRVRLRLRVAAPLVGWWRALEERARHRLPSGVSWVGFLCHSAWRAWRHLLDQEVAYGGIYVRDRHRCTSPVCTRRDVTPHHLRFRSAGGGDEPDNVAAVCSWCHISGIHGGRIRALGTAGHVRWELGRGDPCLVVEGRERVA